MRDRDIPEDIVVSAKNTKLRLILFLLAFAVAVGAFAYGFSRLGHKDPGYYTIQADPAEEAVNYASGIALCYHFTGSSEEIKEEMGNVTRIYSEALLRGYKLLDTENTYEGVCNLAKLNQTFGQEVQVSEELSAILRDAWEKTRDGKGYHLFAGSLNREWESILILSDPLEFDPANNPETAERIRALAEKTADLSQFDLRETGENTWAVTVSPDYLAFLDAGEYNPVILDAGALRDAYLLTILRDALENAGYGDGYLTAESGLTVSLSRQDSGEYCLYGQDDSGKTAKLAYLPAGGGSVCSELRNFPLEKGEFRYYSVGSDIHRSPNYILATGGHNPVLQSLCVVRYDGDIAAAVYEGIKINTRETVEGIENALPEDPDVLVALKTWGSSTVTANHPDRLR